MGGALGIALVSLLLYVSFQSWKARYRALAEFGRVEVAPTVDPLANLDPPGVARWPIPTRCSKC